MFTLFEIIILGEGGGGFGYFQGGCYFRGNCYLQGDRYFQDLLPNAKFYCFFRGGVATFGGCHFGNLTVFTVRKSKRVSVRNFCKHVFINMLVYAIFVNTFY